MTAPKAKTQMERQGFKDPEKGTPEHDKIQTWVYENIQSILEGMFPKMAEQGITIVSRQWEFPVMSGNYIVGYVDLAIITRKKDHPNDWDDIKFFIEVKTAIPSVGELMRQLATYKTYLRGDRVHFMVVCPDDKHRQLLREQRVFFHKYTDPEKLF